MDLIDKYRQLGLQPRKSNKAKIFFIEESKFPSIGDYDEYSWDIELIKDNADREIVEIVGENNIQRGDVVVFEELVGSKQIIDENRIIYGDYGKLIYDGEKLIPWTKLCENDDKDEEDNKDVRYFIPQEFQVILEFPIQYWEYAFDEEAHVPLRLNLFDMITEEIKIPNHEHIGLKALNFNLNNGDYSIIGLEYHEGTFEDQLPGINYFGVANLNTRSFQYLENIPEDIDLDKVLFVSCDKYPL